MFQASANVCLLSNKCNDNVFLERETKCEDQGMVINILVETVSSQFFFENMYYGI